MNGHFDRRYIVNSVCHLYLINADLIFEGRAIVQPINYGCFHLCAVSSKTVVLVRFMVFPVSGDCWIQVQRGSCSAYVRIAANR